MSLSDFWRRGRDRDRDERGDRWRSHEDNRDFGRPNYVRDEQGFERRGWRPGSDYYGNNPARYGERFNDRWENAYGGSAGGSQFQRPNMEPGAREQEGAWDDVWNYGGNMDAGTLGARHRGRGPRGYRRSDERIHEEVCERLTDDDWVDASEIQVTVKEGEVTLAGTVNSRDEKRRAENIIENISGVRDVHNTLRMKQSEARDQSGIARTGQQASEPRH